MTTSLGENPIRVVISNLGAPVAAGMLSQLEALTELRLWPELEIVATNKAATNTSGMNGEDAYACITLVPRAPLTDRWYALTLDPSTAGAEWPVVPNAFVIDGAERGVRFREGSLPLLVAVHLYDKANEHQELVVDFSERVFGDLSLVHVSSSSQCELIPSAESDGFFRISFTCDELAPDEDVVIDVAHGLTSSTGVALNGGEDQRLSIEPTDWVVQPDGGKIYVPPSIDD
jgi:hypothetical protein